MPQINRLSSHPALQVIMRYRNHPSINIIRCVWQRFSNFHFSHVDKNTVLKETKRLSANKVIQDINIPVKFLRKMQYFLLSKYPLISMKQFFLYNLSQLSNL